MGTLGSRVILKASQSLTDWRRKANVARSDVLSISRLSACVHTAKAIAPSIAGENLWHRKAGSD